MGLLRVWAGAVSGGAFYTRWSALVSLLIAGAFSIPSIGEPSIAAYARGVLVATIAWVPLALAIVPVALAERRMPSPAARGILVLSALLVVAVARAFVNDAVSIALFQTPTGGSFSSRTATNIVTAFVLLSIVAIITSRHQMTRRGAGRLHVALARMAEAEAAAARFEARSRRTVDEAVTGLRARRDAMLRGEVDFDTVRAYADDVRAASHRFDALARAHGEPIVAPTGEISVPIERSPAFLERLVPTPWLLVGLTYAIACLPFALAAGGAGVAAAGLAAAAVIDVVAGVVVRSARRGAQTSVGSAQAGARAGVVFLVTWLGAGIAVLGVTFGLLSSIGSLGLVPVFAVPVVAVLISLCRDSLDRARADEASSAHVLSEIARALARVEARSRVPLRRAVELLHGRVQAQCVIFAAAVDDAEPTADEVEAFRRRTDEILDDIGRPAPPHSASAAEELDRLLAAWSVVVVIDARITPAARAALESATAESSTSDPESAAHGADVVGVVNEALVNAIKHASAREARIDIDTTASADLRVRVSTPGELAPRGRRAKAGLGTSGDHARLYQDEDRVVLEAHLDPRAAGAA